MIIEEFKKQTKDSIWEYLDTTAGSDDVYSTHIEGFAPYLMGNHIYLYANGKELVVVCLDKSLPIDELADEEPFRNNHPRYFSETGSRVSPVWCLNETITIMQHCIESGGGKVRIYGLLLTSSRIVNEFEMVGVWNCFNIKVISGMGRMRRIRPNENDQLSGSNLVKPILALQKNGLQLELFGEESFEQEADASVKEEESPEEISSDNDFERILNELLSKDYKVLEDYSDDDTYDDDDEDEDEDEDDIDLDDYPEGSVHTSDDIFFPSGEIEQNQNVSVKVEILRPIPNPREELDNLVGCKDIKRRIDELLALTSYNKMMQAAFPNSKEHKVSLHSVFVGSPGTGKTTVCKIFGSLLRQAGALSKGHVVVCDRGTFIGTLWGDEERSMRQVLEMAQGGVLMIDEAYLMNGKHENDPGKLVIQLLMNILADETQRDIAIVLCGYKEPMEKLLESNPGLQSRFPNKFEFPDFTLDELLEITRRRVKEYEYDFTPEAWDKYCQILTDAYQHHDAQTWGNARFIANQLERIYIQHATRCVSQRPTDKNQIRLLTPEDIKPIELPKAKRRIGF